MIGVLSVKFQRPKVFVYINDFQARRGNENINQYLMIQCPTHRQSHFRYRIADKELAA